MNRPVLVALLGCALLLGCRSRGGSVPESIEPDRESWISRLPATATVQEYATELARLNSDVPASFDPSDGLSVREAEAVALVFNGELRRARLDARVPLLGARQAGVAEDPRFEFDLLRVLESVSNPWVAISGLKFTVPLSNRLADERIAAFASASAAWRAALVAEAALLTELRSAWISWSATHERIRLLEGHLRAVEEVLLIANSQLKAEQIGATEARVLELEKVSRGGDLVAERMREQQLLLDLKALMGLRPEADVELVPSLGPAAGCAATEHGERQLVESNPELAHAQAEFLAADRAMRLEVSRAVPDMEIGALFESEEGVERLGAGVGIPLPLWNKNRRAIAEACAVRRAARSAYQATYQDLVARLARAQADCRATMQHGAWLRERVAPMADLQLADVRRIGELGDMDVLILKDALSTVLETKLQLVEARVEHALAANRRRALAAPTRTPAGESSPK